MTTACVFAAPQVAAREDEGLEKASDHFVIFYPKDYGSFAQRVLVSAEYAYARLTRLLDYELDFKVRIELVTDRDEALKCEEAIGEDHFALSTWPEANALTGNGTGDWILREVSHALTHIITYQTTPASPLFKTLFSFIEHNNQYAPNWYQEGLAMYFETPDEPGLSARRPGVVRLVETIARADMLPTMGELTSGLRRWPAKGADTLFGAAFINYMAGVADDDVFGHWNMEYARNKIPFTAKRVSRIVLGQDWDEFYAAWRKSTYTNAIERSRYTEQTSRLVLSKAWNNDMPQSIPNSNLYSFVREDGSHSQMIVSLDPITGKIRPFVECLGRCEHHWLPDGNKFYYTTLFSDGHRTRTETLFIYDTVKKKRHRPELPGHVRDFAIDGHALWIVTLENDHTVLYRADLSDDDPEAVRLYETAPFERIDTIDVRNNQLVASVYDPLTSRSQIERFDVRGSDVSRTRLTHDAADNLKAFWLTDELIGYIRIDLWDENIWVLHKNELWQARLTNILDGVSHPAMTNDGDLLITQFSAQGSQIAVIPSDVVDRLILKAKQAHVPQHECHKHITHAEQRPPFVHRDVLDLGAFDEYEPGQETTRPYNAFFQLAPNDYTPILGYSAAEGLTIGLIAAGEDILHHHEYLIQLAYLSAKDNVNLSIDYKWKEFPWAIGASIGLQQNTVTWKLLEDENEINNYVGYMTHWAELSTDKRWHTPSLDFYLKLAYRAEFSNPVDEALWNEYKAARVSEWVPELSWTSALLAKLILSHRTPVNRAFIDETGFYTTFDIRIETPFLGASTYTFINELELRWDIIAPWSDTHALNFILKGGYSSSGNPSRLPFVVSSGQGFSFNTPILLHGFPSGLLFGRYYTYARISYTALIANVELGFFEIPVGINRIGTAPMLEWATAWNDRESSKNYKGAIGFDVYIDGRLGYNIPFRLTYGFAWGLGTEGNPQHSLLFTFK